MNILFIYTSQIDYEAGGVQRVTLVLSKYFEKKGINSYFLSFEKSNRNKLINQYFFPTQIVDSEKNILFLKSLVQELRINIIINQAALGGRLSSLCYKIKQDSSVKVISVIHNSLLGNIESFFHSNKKIAGKIPVSLFKIFSGRYLNKLLKSLYLIKYQKKYRLLYKRSDKVVLLSNSYFDEFKFFVKWASLRKVISIANPCTLNEEFQLGNKQNEILFVGRVNITQKRLDLLIKIWEKLHLKFPEWKLSIVGDGPDLDILKRKAQNLNNISFEGYQNPIEYYERAKIFCMTSSYEGFPLVLAEAQYYNAFPILFKSFPSAEDIIKNGVNGILIEPFDIDSYAIELEKLMIISTNNYVTNRDILLRNVDRFSIEEIGQKWTNLFKEILNE